jgi:hypothetical protein
MGIWDPFVLVKEDGMPKCRMRRKSSTWIICLYPDSKRKLQQLWLSISINHHHLLSLVELLLFSFISGPIFSSYDGTIINGWWLCWFFTNWNAILNEANLKSAEGINNKQILDKQQNYAPIYFFIVDAITNMIKNNV